MIEKRLKITKIETNLNCIFLCKLHKNVVVLNIISRKNEDIKYSIPEGIS